MSAFSPEDLADFKRWVISGAIVVLAYGGIAAAMVTWHEPIEANEPGGAIVIEMAPVLMGPQVQEQQDLPPGPEMQMSDAAQAKEGEDKPEEKVEEKVEAKVEQKVEEQVAAKPTEEPPPPDMAPAPDPEVAIPPPPPKQEVKETPQRQEPRPPAPTTSAPSFIPDQTAAVPAAPSPVPTKNSQALVRWQNQISAALERNKRYPPQSQSRREQGVAQVFFSLDRQGNVIESRLVRSAGSAMLDEEALAMLRRAQPFPKPPAEMGEHVDLTVPVRFNLK
jgi:protein TonB